MSFRFMRKDNTIRTIRNGEFIMAYMHIPREYLSRCGAELNSIPRCLKDLLYPGGCCGADCKAGAAADRGMSESR